MVDELCGGRGRGYPTDFDGRVAEHDIFGRSISARASPRDVSFLLESVAVLLGEASRQEVPPEMCRFLFESVAVAGPRRGELESNEGGWYIALYTLVRLTTSLSGLHCTPGHPREVPKPKDGHVTIMNSSINHTHAYVPLASRFIWHTRVGWTASRCCRLHRGGYVCVHEP